MEPLRFAVMCRGPSLDAWQVRAIRRLLETGARLALVIVDATERPALRRTNLLWRLFRRMSRPRAQRPVDASDLFAAAPQLRCTVARRGRFSEYFSAEDVAAIRAHDLDFVLRFGFGIVRGDILSAARYGIWSFHHGDELHYRGGPPCFWEIYRGDPVTGAVLQRLTQRLDGGVILRKGHLKTIDYSYARSVDALFFETADWPAFVASEIRNGARARFDDAPSVTTAPIYRAPSNLAMLKFLAILARNVTRRLLERYAGEEWNVGITTLRPDELLAGRPLRGVQWMNEPAGGWLADPIALLHDGRVHVLCERMNLSSGRAHIAAARFDGTAWSDPATAIVPETHASYPYTFRWENEIYCVPETFEAREVRLYRAVGFPTAWEHAATLLRDIAAVDSTVFAYEGRFWLFCTTREASGTRLYAYHAPALLGPWQPHLANPVKIDVRGARPAGPPILYQGRLYRPAQDSSRTYGGRVAIQRVTALTPERFEEEHVLYVEPEPGSPYGRGLHTISFTGEYCVIDGKRRARAREPLRK